ncbi:MAG: hypothetical protein HQK49_13205 [Oligoflexia bacterium]|nr:hypothetical protein [Oligoflexia bacterium]
MLFVKLFNQFVSIIIFIIAISAFHCSTLFAASLDFSASVATDSILRAITSTDHGPAILGNTDFNHEVIPNLSLNLGTMVTNVTAAAGRIEQDYYGTLAYNFANDFFVAPTFTYYTYYYLNRTNTFEYGLTGGHKRISAGVLYTDNLSGFKTSATCYQLKGNVDLPKAVNINLAGEFGYLKYGDEVKTAWSNYNYYMISVSRTIDTRTFSLNYSDTIKRKEVYSNGTKATNSYCDQSLFIIAIQRF